MAQVPTGTRFYVATAFGSVLVTTIVTNASEAVVTSAGHGLSNADVVEVTSGWGRLNKRYFKVKSVTTDTFVLEGMDTSSTTIYPAGTGIGSVREVTTFTQFDKVMNPQSSGGDPRTVTYKYVESDIEYSINDGFTAPVLTVEIDADAIGGAGYTGLKALTDVQTDTCVKQQLRNGSLIFMPCTAALNEFPRLQDGQINRVVATFNGNNVVTRYAS